MQSAIFVSVKLKYNEASMNQNSSQRCYPSAGRCIVYKGRLILGTLCLFLGFQFLLTGSIPLNRLQVFAAASGKTETSTAGASRRVILMIGDGMGANHRLAGQWSKVGTEGVLTMDSLPIHGWIQTGNVSGGLTDSAAAATAMATGVKTTNGYVGVDPDDADLPTILELAQDLGMRTGLVVTSQVTNATPAAFAAHVSNRNQVLEIASQMLSQHVDVLLGGGDGDWLPDTSLDCNGDGLGKRMDARNLVSEAVAGGYTYSCTPAAFSAIAPGTFHLLGLFGFEKMVWPYTPTLADMTSAALASLEADPDGFFLMVEGSQIDNAAHANDGTKMIDDVKTFDAAVQVAWGFANANPDTLLIVVADHETGGLSLYRAASCNSGDDGPFSIFEGDTFCTQFTTTGHTGVDVPLTAMGPGSGYLVGTHQNTMIYTTMRRHLTTFEYNYLPVISAP
jgi:alkaline phosphatase